MLAKKPKGATEKRQGSGVASLLWMFVGAILTLMIGVFLYLWNPFDMGNEAGLEERTVQPIEQANNTGNANGNDGDFEFYDLLPEQEMVGIPDATVLEEDMAEGEGQVETLPEPDVVIEAEDDAGNNTNSNANNNANNYGISEESILNPMGEQGESGNQNNVQESQQTSEPTIEIVEEEGTYDEPQNNNQGGGQNSNQSGAEPTVQGGNGEPSSASITVAQSNKTYILQINSFGTASEADKRRAQVLMAGVDARVVRMRLANGQTVYQVITAPTANRQNIISTQQKLQNNGIDSLIVEQNR